MPSIAAPQPGGAVEHGTALGREIVHVLGARQEPRSALERAVRRERQPIGFEIVGLPSQCGFAALTRHARSLQSPNPPIGSKSRSNRRLAGRFIVTGQAQRGPLPVADLKNYEFVAAACAKLNSDRDPS